jgi:hypothetical protein
MLIEALRRFQELVCNSIGLILQCVACCMLDCKWVEQLPTNSGANNTMLIETLRRLQELFCDRIGLILQCVAYCMLECKCVVKIRKQP